MRMEKTRAALARLGARGNIVTPVEALAQQIMDLMDRYTREVTEILEDPDLALTRDEQTNMIKAIKVDTDQITRHWGFTRMLHRHGFKLREG